MKKDFYEDYLKTKEIKEQEKNNSKVIIKKQSLSIKIFDCIVSIISAIFRIVIYIILVILLSILATIIFNGGNIPGYLINMFGGIL